MPAMQLFRDLHKPSGKTSCLQHSRLLILRFALERFWGSLGARALEVLALLGLSWESREALCGSLGARRFPARYQARPKFGSVHTIGVSPGLVSERWGHRMRHCSWIGLHFNHENGGASDDDFKVFETGQHVIGKVGSLLGLPCGPGEA